MCSLPRACLPLAVLASALAAQTATYTTFGSGCAGSGGQGLVLPQAYATKMASGANTFPHARANMRYQQVFLASEVGGARVFTELCLRLDETSGGQAQAQQLELLLGHTPSDPATMSTTFSSNYSTIPPTSVFKGSVNLPQHAGGGGLQDFKICLKFSKLWIWVPRPNENLLTEWVNTSASATSHFEDKCQALADCTTTRVWGTTTTATTGSIERNGGLIMSLKSIGANAPVLGSTGLPRLAQSFSVDLSQALASTAAGLILGTSNTSWGTIPLPLDLTPLGATGCSLLVSFDTLGVFPTTAMGTASASFAIPNATALLGVVFHNQWLVVDANANALGVAWSNGGTGRIGT